MRANLHCVYVYGCSDRDKINNITQYCKAAFCFFLLHFFFTAFLLLFLFCKRKKRDLKTKMFMLICSIVLGQK